ncbi:uncharacterized protein LOC119577575 [Penaeus monodon]|uniref:uncharacterized protein LOC119577575 n=1 Tax=Penaeus monodon TaxID=6687 RepID=UPI0018A6D848|nr:uncharacterized protein LOC119577575 [Penaeus monodon]
MLKWTLRNPSDAPTPPPPEVRYQVREAEVKLNLKDSNKCWMENQVKVAQVRSTSRILGTSKENGDELCHENGKLGHGKENESIFKKWISSAHSDEDKKRKRHHKHIRCNPLDPLRLFSGEVTDSDTGSVYMKLDHTPAALQPRPQVVATTGPHDPRRKPLIDISNGDYSDLRKHLQQISASHLHHPYHHHHHHHHQQQQQQQQHQHHHHHHHHSELPPYLQQFAPSSRHVHHHHQHSYVQEGQFQTALGHAHLPRPEPLGATASQANLLRGHRHRSSSSSRSRSRSSSRSRPMAAVNSSLLAGSTVAFPTTTVAVASATTTTTTITTTSNCRGMAEGQSQSRLHEVRGASISSSSSSSSSTNALKRHSIADIPTESSFRGVWEIQKARRGRSSSHERKRDDSRERVRLPRYSRDRRKEDDEQPEDRGRQGSERVEGRRASRERAKDEPIYEKVGSANTSGSSITSKKSKSISGSSISSRKSQNSYDNAIYMSMKDLRAHCQLEDVEEWDNDHLYSSLHVRISPDPNKTPVHMRDHLYENMLYLPMTEIKNVLKKSLDRSRPLPDPPNFDDQSELDDTCAFTSEPQKDIHKPVAIKISNDLIARFGKSPNDRQHPMPQYGLYIASQPSKKPCKIAEGCQEEEVHSSHEAKPTKVYKSTGQHVHINYSEKHTEPTIPLHNLRPPPPPPPRKCKSGQSSSITKSKSKSKASSKQKSESHLPVIYENTRQEEELTQSAKKRKLRHSMAIEFSFDDDDGPINKSSEDASVEGSTPRGHNTSSSDNPDSGVSEGITTPLVSPMSAPRSPQTPRSDSLLEEPCTPLSMEDLHSFKENGQAKLTKENVEASRNSTIFSNVSHDITDPRFLESFLKDGPFSRRSFAGQSSFLTEACIDDMFHQIKPPSLQQTMSSISCSHLDSFCLSPKQYFDTLKSKSADVSKMLLSAVGRNLFSESTKVSTPNRNAAQLDTSASRRHSVAGLEDISRRLSKIEFSDDTSLWGMEVSDHCDSALKKSKSLQCLSSSAALSSPPNVPLMESMAEILKDPEARCDSRPFRGLDVNGEQTSPNTSEQSGQWWAGGCGEEDEGGERGGGRATKGSGRAGGHADGATGSLASSPASQHHQPPPAAAQPSPTHHLSPNRNPTLPLPVEMSGGLHLAVGHEGACFSVPLGPSSCEDSARPDLSQCVSGCGDSESQDGSFKDPLTARQQRRREESSYRLQRMLQDNAQPLVEDEPEESVSADWSMEALLDEYSTFDHQDLDEELSEGAPPSPDSVADSISLCTLDSDAADNVFLSPKLVEKIKQVSEEKMLARLRKSFRSKKGKGAPAAATTAPADAPVAPKVGIFMFVDNPMYLSPDVKKEVKFVRPHIAKNEDEGRNNVWYVGNPMYHSPEPSKVRNVNYEVRQKVLCEKENMRNSRIAKVVCQNNNNRKPLANIWLQSNPCYESPDIKTLQAKQTGAAHRLAAKAHESTYLTPIPVKPPRDFAPRPTVVPAPNPVPQDDDDDDILDHQKFLDHEYCTIPGDESDSWVTQSTASRKSDSPLARRSLEFGASCKTPKGKKGVRVARSPVTPSRLWRQTTRTQHSTPRKYQGTLEKNLDTGAPLGTRSHRTPRAVKRGKKTRETFPNDSPSPTPPPLPARPHHTLRHYDNDRSNDTVGLEDTNDFHRKPQDDLDDTAKFQLPPDSVYESITFLERGVDPHDLPPGYTPRRHHLRRPSGNSSALTLSPALSRPCSSRGSRSRSHSKNGLRPGSPCEGSLRARARRGSTTKKVSKKYRARDVLAGKGQLKLAVYENFGLLTIHIIEARKLKSRYSSVCNPYVKISLVPDCVERTFCRTPLIRATNAPSFDQKFSFDFLPEDLDKRLLISVWSRDTLRKRSEFLGCMSFSVAHISNKRVHGWFRLLTETLGRRKHFAVSFLNATTSGETSKSKMEEVLILDDNQPPTTAHDPTKHRDRLDVNTTGLNLNENELVGSNNIQQQQQQQPKGQTPYTITVTVVRGNQGFGFSVAWTKPPRVERVEPGLPAEQAGLKPGDYIIFVGQFNVVKYEEEQVLDIIRDSGDVLSMEVYRRGVSKHPRGLVNGFVPSRTASEQGLVNGNESHPRKKLSHITFNTEVGWGLNV